MRSLFLLFLPLLMAIASACQSDADCGSADYSQPGLCLNDICQCGFGYAGNVPIDPATCAFACSPPPVSDSVVFLVEPNVTVAASAGKLVLDVALQPFLKRCVCVSVQTGKDLRLLIVDMV